MNVRCLLIMLGASVAYLFAGSASGQSSSSSAELFPVDQTVSDLDPRAASLRHVEQGIGVFGQTGSLYQRGGLNLGSTLDQSLPQRYLLRQPGVRAWIDQPDYLVRDALGQVRLNVAPGQDRQFIGLFPPNTVFDLVPHPAPGFVPYIQPGFEGWRDTRINTRIDGLIRTPIRTDISGQPGTNNPADTPLWTPVAPGLFDWPTPRLPLRTTAAPATQPDVEQDQATDALPAAQNTPHEQPPK